MAWSPSSSTERSQLELKGICEERSRPSTAELDLEKGFG
jgi:hypothetical protein